MRAAARRTIPRVSASAARLYLEILRLLSKLQSRN
jgi:uncharacterized YccA/Bax inhibitor family protein